MPERQARPGQEQWQALLQGQDLLPEQARPGQEQEMLPGQALLPEPLPPFQRRELSFPGRPPLLKENAPLRTETFRGALRLRRALQPERPSGGQLRSLPFLPSRPELGHSSS